MCTYVCTARLRQLKKFGLRREILVQFYRSAIESILAFSICAWFGVISQRQRSRLDKIVGSELTSQQLYTTTDPNTDLAILSHT